MKRRAQDRVKRNWKVQDCFDGEKCGSGWSESAECKVMRGRTRPEDLGTLVLGLDC